MKTIIYWIDLFSGAGGTTTGIHHSNAKSKVIACVNHDAMAIESHKANHPDCIHFVEDVRDMKVVAALKTLVKQLRKETPNCIINIWASLECTNFSNAKGGIPRDADSRTLANALFFYMEEINPEYLFIENVREFQAWGPLDNNGKPVSRKKGSDYLRWTNTIKSYGYNYEFKYLNSADYGAYTSRVRYFGQFAIKNLPITWPEITHCKNPIEGGLFPAAEKWKPVKEVLDLNDEGKSILTRKKPLADSTLKRIYAGLIKFIAGTTEKEFLTSYYGNGSAHSAHSPCPTITTNDRFSKIFIDQQYGNSLPSSANKPVGTITTNPKFNLVTANYYLMNPGWGGHSMSIEQPSPVIIARQDKAPLYLIESTSGQTPIKTNKDDTEIMKQIKQFMTIYGIIDIKMRMLKVIELKRIQGFPESYILKGTQKDQKKFIGNAVHPLVAQKLDESNFSGLLEYYSIAV